MRKESVWVWFKGNEKGGYWLGGFLGTTSTEGGILIERPDFVSCRVPEWRISIDEPDDKKVGPKIPEDTLWKLI